MRDDWWNEPDAPDYRDLGEEDPHPLVTGLVIMSILAMYAGIGYLLFKIF